MSIIGYNKIFYTRPELQKHLDNCSKIQFKQEVDALHKGR